LQSGGRELGDRSDPGPDDESYLLVIVDLGVRETAHGGPKALHPQ